MGRVWNIKVRGGVMGLAILISVLVTLSCGLLLTRAQYYSYATHQYDLRENLVNNCHSGLQLLLSSGPFVQPGSTKRIDLFGNETDSVELTRKPWGGFEIIISKAFSGKKKIIKTALVGQTCARDSARTSLYLCDMDRPLSLCGNTRLDGKLFLPKSGVKRAYIEGQNYVGDKLLYGTRFNSKQQLPKINADLISSNKRYLSGQFQDSDSVIEAEAFNFPDSLVQPFNKRTLLFYSTGRVRLTMDKLEGNIIVVASSIHVSTRTRLNGVLFYAKEITVDDNCTGNFQAFASKSIRIGKKCELDFPTVLAAIVSPASGIKDEPVVFVDEETRILGELFCYDEQPVFNIDNVISIQPGVTLTGELYVNGLLDLRGNVYGSVYCHRFMMKTPSSVYENHLLNTEINALKLPKHFAGINLLANENKRTVVRWM